jgi:hypothetical protein
MEQLAIELRRWRGDGIACTGKLRRCDVRGKQQQRAASEGAWCHGGILSQNTPRATQQATGDHFYSLTLTRRGAPFPHPIGKRRRKLTSFHHIDRM